MRTTFRMTLLVGISIATLNLAPAASTQRDTIVFTNSSGEWTDCPNMPSGCKMLSLYGDTTKPGEFAVRFKYPARYRIGPHLHAADEHATVISGGPFHLAVGDTFDEKTGSAKTLNAGDLAVVPAGTHHFAWMDSETILQVNGIGPFKREFLDPGNKSSGVQK